MDQKKMNVISTKIPDVGLAAVEGNVLRLLFLHSVAIKCRVIELNAELALLHPLTMLQY
jgi:hypothetical protein